MQCEKKNIRVCHDVIALQMSRWWRREYIIASEECARLLNTVLSPSMLFCTRQVAGLNLELGTGCSEVFYVVPLSLEANKLKQATNAFAVTACNSLLIKQPIIRRSTVRAKVNATK